MPKGGMKSSKFSHWFLRISLPLLILDQITKWWVVFNMRPPSYEEGVHRIPVIEGFFWINRVHNQGMAWGIGNGSSWAPLLFPVILVIAFFSISTLWKKGGFPTTLTKLAASLILSGILGNFIDRILQGFFLEKLKNESFLTRLSEGYVVDFLDFVIPIIRYHFPSFNVADSCISVAAGLLLYSSFFCKRYKSHLEGIEKKASQS